MNTMNKYQVKLRSVLSPAERRVISKLNTPQKVQDFLDSFPVNVLGKREHTMRSPREVLKIKKAHCMEGALLAATSLAYFGREPLLLDLQSADDDLDHVVALFKENGYWGAISKTNHPVLRYRDPVYKTVRELALSYFHEYFLQNGKKTLRAYSKPFNLAQFSPEQWVAGEGDLDWLAEKLDDSPHLPMVPKANVQKLRNASHIEIKMSEAEEWDKKGKRSH